MPRRFVYRFANTTTNDPADDVVWQWHELEDPDEGGADPAQVLDIFAAHVLQNLADSGLDEKLAEDMALYDWRLYPLPVGDPVAERVEATNPVTVGSGVYPHEVSIVCTFLATSGIRDKAIGRSYVGRLANVGVNDTGTGRPVTSLRNAVGNFFVGLHEDRVAAGGTPVRYSPATGTSALIHRYRVDNAWDTQRRRGVEASSFQIFDPVEP